MSDKDLQGVADCVSDIGQHFSRRLHLSRRDHLKGPDQDQSSHWSQILAAMMT